MNEMSFKPAWWLPGPHLQTLWAVLFRKRINTLAIRRERFELPDGDFVDLDWVGVGSGPIVILLHGLEGSIHSPYARGMLQTIAQNKWRGVLMHFRGCSGEPNRLPRSYHSGETNDFSVVVQALHQREPTTPLAAVGFSLGGNVLLKWLGETNDNNLLSAAVAISVPFELDKCSKRIQCGFSRVYQNHFLRRLHKRLKKKFHLKSPMNIKVLPKFKTLQEFDDQITAPLHGFKDACEYYTLSSSRQYLKAIQVPTLLLQSKDDPFMTSDIIPGPDELSSFVQLEMTEAGGHVGFVSGKTPWQAEYWLEQRVPGFLNTFITHKLSYTRPRNLLK